MKKIDTDSINTLRFLSIDQIQKAKSGHPGLPLGTAPLMYTIWDRFMHFNPKNPNWLNRDRFVLSPGHGSALLYSMLYLTGYGLTMEDLKNFRQWGSKTPGHPEYGVTAGVDLSTGPLGHGFAMAVGMALAEEMLAKKYNKKGFKVINHYTYGITSDGDQMEGVASEAASLAGTWGLGKLIFLYDDNHITIEGNTNLAFTENVEARYKAYGWQVLKVTNAEDIDEIAKAIKEAQKDTKHPSLIIVPTHIGYGSPKQDSASSHGEPLGVENVAATKAKAGWDPEKFFYVPAAVQKHFDTKVGQGKKEEAAWDKMFKAYSKAYPELAAELTAALEGKANISVQALAKLVEGKEAMATREASGNVLQELSKELPNLVGGSADLGPSNKTAMKAYPYFSATEVEGRNIHFGIREHAMGCIVNGLTLHGGLVAFGATFEVFADFMRPAVRMAGLMKIGSIFVLTHDSICVGEDGPTHQPVEQTMSLRLIPNVSVIRPADAYETVVAWKLAVENKKQPTCLVLTRQKLPVLTAYKKVILKGAAKGGYVISPANGKPKAILIATGSEVNLALATQKDLAAKHVPVTVVSMPSWDKFDKQSAAYKEAVLPKDVARIAIEAGITLGWSKYTGSEDRVIGFNRFGSSGPGPVVYEKFGMTVKHIEQVVAKI